MKAQCRATNVGGELDSSASNVRKGYLPVGALVGRRLLLSDLSFRAANWKMRCTRARLVAMLIGYWSAVFSFTKPLMSVLSKLYHFVAKHGQDLEAWDTLPRAAADELLLASMLAPWAEVDVTAPQCERLFLTDASETNGAAVAAPLPEEMRRPLWLAGDKKGRYSRLDSKARCALRRLGYLPSSLGSRSCDVMPSLSESVPPFREPAILFDLLEVGVQRCCTCGYLSEGLAAQGVITGPFIHGRTSVHFELTCDRVLVWLAWLIRNGRANVLVLVAGSQECSRSSAAATVLGNNGEGHEAPAEMLASAQAPTTYAAPRLARECRRSAVLLLSRSTSVESSDSLRELVVSGAADSSVVLRRGPPQLLRACCERGVVSEDACARLVFVCPCPRSDHEIGACSLADLVPQIRGSSGSTRTLNASAASASSTCHTDAWCSPCMSSHSVHSSIELTSAAGSSRVNELQTETQINASLCVN